MSPESLAIGTAVPDHGSRRQDAAGSAAEFANAPPGRGRALAALDRPSGIRGRGSVLPEHPGARPCAREFFPPAEHGNMSTATILFPLDRLRTAGGPGPGAARAFGPGPTVEMAILDRSRGGDHS